MTDAQHLHIVPSDPPGALVHQALQKTLVAPALPGNFRAQVMAAVLNDRLQEVEVRRLALENEHALALQQLRRGHVLLRRDTLALIAVSTFAIGSCASLAVPWLHAVLGLDSAMTVPALALLIGGATGVSVWFERARGNSALFGVGPD